LTAEVGFLAFDLDLSASSELALLFKAAVPGVDLATLAAAVSWSESLSNRG
jgi:hypothetical protein